MSANVHFVYTIQWTYWRCGLVDDDVNTTHGGQENDLLFV